MKAKIVIATVICYAFLFIVYAAAYIGACVLTGAAFYWTTAIVLSLLLICVAFIFSKIQELLKNMQIMCGG